MTLDKMLADVSRKIERDAWTDLVAAPPSPVDVANAAALAAQLLVSRLGTIQHGCSREQAKAFVLSADDLAVQIDAMGRDLLRCSVLCTWSKEADEFAAVLLDALAADDD